MYTCLEFFFQYVIYQAMSLEKHAELNTNLCKYKRSSIGYIESMVFCGSMGQVVKKLALEDC